MDGCLTWTCNSLRVIEVTAGDDTAVYFLDGDQWFVSEGPLPVEVETRRRCPRNGLNGWQRGRPSH